ncbi:MAG: bifunctional folylpolyglutamate synthase/dihydrofolate synthase, partial [Lentisphaeria bacterium]|nr:bifunctional folylpolyglutamate synthase/dihydrofolate synthase [Lentisphaeria bacterium]
MNYQQALDYLNTRIMFGIKLGLANMELILEALGNPQNNLRFIHLAGTNGKGSTGCLLNAGLMTAGKVGFYSSPHLIDTRERFRLNGVAVSEIKFTKAVEKLVAAVADFKEVTEPTFFEV